MGLAAQGVQPDVTVRQIVQALMSGASPEELVASGIPVEMIEQAMMAIQQQQTPPQNVGLAGMQIPGGV